jgi:hypothetical protein
VRTARHPVTQPFSVTVVSGFRFAVDLVTYRPVMALRWWVPAPLLEPLSVTVVRGCLTAVAGFTYRPVMALRERPLDLAIGPS